MASVARVDGVRYAYGAVTALHEVSLDVEPGEILGIVGPDGAGKSTLLRLWVPVMRSQGGRIEVGGCDAVADPESLRDLVGYMPQRFSLYEDLSIDENIHFYAELHGVAREDFVRRRAELLRFTRLDRFTDRRAGQLSGGMKQKLGLICVLIHRPAVLFLDEPTNGVDPVSRREFWEILRALVAGIPGDDPSESRVAIVVSTPYMDEAERCHRVAILDHGRVRALGTPDDLRAKVPGVVLEVTTSEAARARGVIAETAGDPHVALFGTRLRARSTRADARNAVANALRDGGIDAEVAVVPPSMEDVFVSLSRAEAAP